MAEEKLIDDEWSEDGLDFSDEDEISEEERTVLEDTEDSDFFFELGDEDELVSADSEALAEESVDEIPDASVTADKSDDAVIGEKDDVTADKNSDAAEASKKKNDSTDVEKTASGKEKKLFGKKKEKGKSQLEVKIAELEEQRVRQLAEFENFRKRSEREKSQMFEMGAKDVIEKILPVIDNFERGLMGVPEEQKEEPFVQGMELVYKQILTTFEALGVQPIEAVGKEFDPSMHNAVMAVDDDSLESGTIAEELQKGYLYKDSVVRHSMVKVVN